jgi:glycerol uptake facilitator-like aquaporin
VKKILAEFIGTAILATVVVGSGIMAENLTEDIGVQLLINAAATAAVLWILITTFAGISGAHFNPVVTAIALFRRELSPFQSIAFILAQTAGAISGTILANGIYGNALIDISEKSRDGGHLLLSEVIATAGLVFVVYRLGSIKSGERVAVGVASWIFAAYFFTSSTSFANPAITIGRIFSNSFAGIAPHSAATFIPFQITGALIGYLAFRYFTKELKRELSI